MDKTDLTGGNSLKDHTTGVLLGTNAMPDRENLVSWYAGYETTDGNAQVLDLNMRTAYMGGKYVHLLSRADRHDIYAKVDAVGAYTSSDLQRTVGGSDASGSTHTVSYNAAVRLGMNYYFPFMSALTPEIGLGVTGGRTKAFGISGENDDSINEKYDAANMHVAYADASLRWFQNWHPTLGTPLVKTLVAGGVRYNFNHSVDIGGSVGMNYSRGAVELPTTYQYLNTALILDFSKNTSLTLGYVGVYDSTGHSHNATAKFEYSF